MSSPSMFRSTSRDSFLSHFEDNSAVCMYARNNKKILHERSMYTQEIKNNRTLNRIIPFVFILSESTMDDFSSDSMSTTTIDELLSLISSASCTLII